jgi:hypothetical protein
MIVASEFGWSDRVGSEYTMNLIYIFILFISFCLVMTIALVCVFIYRRVNRIEEHIFVLMLPTINATFVIFSILSMFLSVFTIIQIVL